MINNIIKKNIKAKIDVSFDQELLEIAIYYFEGLKDDLGDLK